MNDIQHISNDWSLHSIEIMQNKRIRITLEARNGGRRQQFTTRDFGLRRGAKAAALAKFMAASWGGDVEEVYKHVTAIPREWVGELPFPPKIETLGWPKLAATG